MHYATIAMVIHWFYRCPRHFLQHPCCLYDYRDSTLRSMGILAATADVHWDKWPGLLRLHSPSHATEHQCSQTIGYRSTNPNLSWRNTSSTTMLCSHVDDIPDNSRASKPCTCIPKETKDALSKTSCMTRLTVPMSKMASIYYSPTFLS